MLDLLCIQIIVCRPPQGWIQVFVQKWVLLFFYNFNLIQKFAMYSFLTIFPANIKHKRDETYIYEKRYTLLAIAHISACNKYT